MYHKKAQELYPKEWIDKFRDSIVNQTYKDFIILEHNYGNEKIANREDKFSIFPNSVFFTHPRGTFVHSMNDLLKEAFENQICDYVFNTNVDDYFAVNRIERQLIFLEQGYDVVASNFHLVRDGNVYHSHRMNEQNIGVELARNNNPIGHPVVAYNRKFWENNKYIPEEIPMEDLKLWQRAYKNGAKFKILPDFLLYHRIHNQSVCQNPENR